MTPPARASASWDVASEAETEALGAMLARHRPDLSSAPFVIELHGELGAGKTTFARGALTALGAAPPIKSPSYALLEIYTLESLVALHLDLYRLIDPAELEQLGLRDYHRPQHLWLIEWPERGTGHLPVPDLELRFYVRPQGHRIEAQSCSEAGAVTLNTARMATRH